MNVSVIIPAINESANIAQSVRSAWSANAGEVIVVDGGSRDNTRGLAERAGARVIGSPPGRGRQQNTGAAAAQGEILLFLHADCQLGPDCIRQVLAVGVENPSMWGAFRQRIDAPGISFRLLERGNAWRITQLGLPYGDQAVFVHRVLFEQLDGFPELPIMEDYMLARRARRVARPLLLPGPVRTDARRWIANGVTRQTIRNWLFVLAVELRVSPHTLARFYRRHDQR